MQVYCGKKFKGGRLKFEIKRLIIDCIKRIVYCTIVLKITLIFKLQRCPVSTYGFSKRGWHQHYCTNANCKFADNNYWRVTNSTASIK